MKNLMVSWSNFEKLIFHLDLNYGEYRQKLTYDPSTFDAVINCKHIFDRFQIYNIDDIILKIKELEEEGWNKETIKAFFLD